MAHKEFNNYHYDHSFQNIFQINSTQIKKKKCKLLWHTNGSGCSLQIGSAQFPKIKSSNIYNYRPLIIVKPSKNVTFHLLTSIFVNCNTTHFSTSSSDLGQLLRQGVIAFLQLSPLAFHVLSVLGQQVDLGLVLGKNGKGLRSPQENSWKVFLLYARDD